MVACELNVHEAVVERTTGRVECRDTRVGHAPHRRELSDDDQARTHQRHVLDLPVVAEDRRGEGGHDGVGGEVDESQVAAGDAADGGEGSADIDRVARRPRGQRVDLPVDREVEAGQRVVRGVEGCETIAGDPSDLGEVATHDHGRAHLGDGPHVAVVHCGRACCRHGIDHRRGRRRVGRLLHGAGGLGDPRHAQADGDACDSDHRRAQSFVHVLPI